MERRLEGRVAVITAAGSGIGRATAVRMAGEGARVVVNDIDADAALATAELVKAEGGDAVAHPADVTSADEVDELVAAAVERHGRLDVMHNNAGYGRPSPLAELTDESFEDVRSVTFDATVYGTRAALRPMLRQGSGVIVNTASNAAFGATGVRAIYGAAKAGVVNLTKSTAVEYGRHGIRAVAICPGPIETPAFRRFAPDLDFYAAQIPMGRLGRAEEVAALAAFLASDDAAYVSGVAIPVDGAMMARLPEPYLTPDDVGR